MEDASVVETLRAEIARLSASLHALAEENKRLQGVEQENKILKEQINQLLKAPPEQEKVKVRENDYTQSSSSSALMQLMNDLDPAFYFLSFLSIKELNRLAMVNKEWRHHIHHVELPRAWLGRIKTPESSNFRWSAGEDGSEIHTEGTINIKFSEEPEQVLQLEAQSMFVDKHPIGTASFVAAYPNLKKALYPISYGDKSFWGQAPDWLPEFMCSVNSVASVRETAGVKQKRRTVYGISSSRLSKKVGQEWKFSITAASSLKLSTNGILVERP